MKLFDKVMIAAGLSIIGYWCWNTLNKAFSKSKDISALRKRLEDTCLELSKSQADGVDRDRIRELNDKIFDISYELAKLLPGSEDRKIDALASILFSSQKKGFELENVGKYSKFVDLTLASASKMIAVKAVRKAQSNVSN